MKRLFCILFFLTLSSPALAQELNAGFVQGLWYGSNNVFADQQTRIYVAVRNNTGADLTGTVEFFDNEERIKRNNISALDGRIVESWADWTPTYGEHTITARISRTEIHKVGTSTESVEIVSTSASDTFFVDYDTDNDGIGNQDDEDDDGDGIDDEKEISDGTNPLDRNDPNSEDTNQEDNTEENDVNEEYARKEDNNNDPQGLEKYVNGGQGDSILSSITSAINRTKRIIDSYRDERNQNDIEETVIEEEEAVEEISVVETASSTNSINSTSSISLPIRSYKTVVIDMDQEKDKDLNQTDDEGGIFITLFDLIKNITSSLLTFVLFLLSAYLSNPAIVQITFLILILLLIYKIMKRLGGRQG